MFGTDDKYPDWHSKDKLFQLYYLVSRICQQYIYIYIYIYIFIQVLHIFKLKLQSPGTIFLVCLGINQQKSAQKSNRYGNIK